MEEVFWKAGVKRLNLWGIIWGGTYNNGKEVHN